MVLLSCLVLASGLGLHGCSPSPAPVPTSVVVEEIGPPAALGVLERVEVAGPMKVPAGTAMRLDLAIWRTVARDGEGAHLVTRLDLSNTENESKSIAALSQRAIGSEDTLSMALPSAPVLPGEYPLDFYLVDPDEPDVPRSPILRARLVIDEEAEPLTAGPHQLDGLPDVVRLCSDGRIVSGNEGAFSVLSTHSSTSGLIPLDEGSGQSSESESPSPPMSDLLLDWRCTQAYAHAGERFLAVDLLNRRVDFDERVENLAAIIFDANPRYVLLLLSDGGIKRYYRRDDEWSVYSGRLSAVPQRHKGRLLTTRDEHRVAIMVEGPELCVLRDNKKVRPRCAAVPFQDALDLAWLPFGFADETWSPWDRQRAAVPFERDLEARDQEEAIGTLLVLQEDALLVYGVDGAFVARRLPLEIADPRELRVMAPDEVAVIGSSSVAYYDPLGAGLLASEPLIDSEIDAAADLVPAPALKHVAATHADGLTRIYTANGAEADFVVSSPESVVRWSRDGELMGVVGVSNASVHRPDGITVITAP